MDTPYEQGKAKGAAMYSGRPKLSRNQQSEWATAHIGQLRIPILDQNEFTRGWLAGYAEMKERAKQAEKQEEK